MANKQVQPTEKKEKSKKKASNSTSQSLPLLHDESEVGQINGFHDPSTFLSTPGRLNDQVVNPLGDDSEDAQFNPEQNGLRLDHRSGWNSGAIPKCSILKNLKKLKGINGAANGESSKFNSSKKSKKGKSHNSSCCDMFCGHSQKVRDADDPPFSNSNADNHQINFGWNDVNGGGIHGFVNPNLTMNPQTDPNIDQNSVSVESLNVLESEERTVRNGRMSRDISEGSLSEMIDEGAVCDFDRLQLQEYEEMYEIENLELSDHEFNDLESPDLLFSYLDSSRLSQSYKHETKIFSDKFSNNNVFGPHNPEVSRAPAQGASFRPNPVHFENHVDDFNVEDDFIDADLPSKASGRNSSESFSESDEEAAHYRGQFDEPISDYHNDLSGAGNSRCLSVSSENSSAAPENNLGIVNRGSNIDLNKDLYDCDNSSESENGNNLEDISDNPSSFDFDDVYSNDHVTSSYPHGADGHYRRTCISDDRGVNASGGEKVSNSAEFPMCNCPSVNSFSQSSSYNRVNDLSCRNSNFQSDESNKKQKIFNKFLIYRQSCESQAAQTSHGCNSLSCENSSNLHCVSTSSLTSELSSSSQQTHVFLPANCEHPPTTSEGGVSEPIYEDIDEYMNDNDESANKMGASSGFTEHYKNNIDSTDNKHKKSSRIRTHKVISSCKSSTSSSSSTRSTVIEKVMIWSEYEAYIQQVKQIGTSACGPTAVINVLKALDSKVDKDEVSRVIRAKLRMEEAPIPLYLFSRAVAGTEAEDLLQGVETLTHGKLRGRFFKFWPPREVHLIKWLGYWMKKGAVPIATLNLQRGVLANQPIPDAWHHQMVYGVSSKDVYLTNPQEKVPEDIIMEQLTSDSVLLIDRQDVVKRFRDTSDLRELIVQSDDRWCTMNVLGQVVNVLREEGLVTTPGYRTQLTSHIAIPAVYETGVTFFVHSNTEAWTELQSVSELPLKSTEDLTFQSAEDILYAQKNT